jgi:ABC-2 type transport system ATP-binding protein
MLQTEGLTKAFETTIAVQDLNVHVHAGEIYGFLGPNGAGKTTTIRLLLGLLEPTAGHVFLFGDRNTKDTVSLKRRIGVVAEEPLSTTRMTGWEFIRFFADLNLVSHPEERMTALFQTLDLWDARHARIGAYSRGMRQKLSLLRALVHSPDLLILDEPVSGLDPYGIMQVRQLVEEHRRRGGAVLISSHVLSEIERSADRVGILHQGRLLVEDTIDGIRHRLGRARIMKLTLVALPPALPDALRQIHNVERVEVNDNQIDVHMVGQRDIRPEIFQSVVAQGGALVEMTTEHMSLEEAFVTITHQNVTQLAGAA